MKAIASVATTAQFVGLLERMKKTLHATSDHTYLFTWEMCEPEGTYLAPYAFKLGALRSIQESHEHVDCVLWLDSSIVPLRSLEPIWERIERDGYWFSENWHGKNGGGWTSDRSQHYTNADWTAPEAWPCIQSVTGITAEENAKIGQIVGGAFGLNIRSIIGEAFLLGLEKMAQGGGFNGDRSVHRHDQTCMSALAHKLGMKPTVPPAYFTDDGHQTDETILVSRRGWAE